MSGEDRTEDSAPEPEEEQNRPYRWFVVILFATAIILACGLLMRGIVRHLDRMPSSKTLDRPELVDVRALRACAEDFDRLEARVRKEAGMAFAEAGGVGTAGEPWEETTKQLELERLQIVARCRLDEQSQDSVARDLGEAATQIENLLRSYSLLYARHREDGARASNEAHAAIQRANEALKTR